MGMLVQFVGFDCMIYFESIKQMDAYFKSNGDTETHVRELIDVGLYISLDSTDCCDYITINGMTPDAPLEVRWQRLSDIVEFEKSWKLVSPPSSEELDR